MPNVIENAIIPLRSGVDLESADSPDAQAWRQTLKILSEQPGCVRLATGLQVENPDTMQMLIGTAPSLCPQHNKPLHTPHHNDIMRQHRKVPAAAAAASTRARPAAERL